MTMSTYKALAESKDRFNCWYSSAGLEAYAHWGRWGTAGNFAKALRSQRKWQWVREQLAAGGGQPIFQSDFDRATGYEDYNRALYYYRRQGGVIGFMSTLDLCWGRQVQELGDFLSNGVQPGGAETPRVIVHRRLW